MIAQDLEAEQAVLGVLLMDASLVGSLELQAGHFSDATHQGIFHEIRIGYENNRTVSPVSLKEKFDPQYLAGLVSSRGIIDLHGYSKRLIELCTTRQLRQAAEYVLSGASNSECVAALTNAIDDAARESLSSQLRTAQQVALNVTNALADDAPCYPTGLGRLDFAMNGGLQQGRLYGLAAESGHGKTLLASTISNNLKNSGVPHLFICAEMGENETHQRSMAKDMGIDVRAFYDKGKRGENFWSDLGYCATNESNNLIYYDDPFLTFERLRQVVCAAVARYKIKGFILDYWQLVTGMEKGEQKADFLGRVAQWEAAACKRYKLFGINTAQLNREGEVLGSGGLKRACDQMYNIVRPEETEPYAFMEMTKSRYTKFMHVGSKDRPSLKINETGGYFEQMNN